MRLTEIQLLSNDLKATTLFYSDLLGFKMAYADDQRVSFSVGASILTFIKHDENIPVYHFAFNIPPATLDEALQWTKQRTTIMPISETEEIADFDSWKAKAFYFKDNNENILEFIARYNLKDNYTKPFGSDAILSISEIGIVVDDVVTTRQSISFQYNVPIFSQPPLPENFTALGDDHGLFILSKRGREWYATDIKAESSWSRITFEIDGDTQEITTE